MNITGYAIVRNVITTSDNEMQCKPPYLEFLLTPKKDTIRIMYNLDYSVANLLALLGYSKEDLWELNNTTKLYSPPYKITYIKGKFFSVKKETVNADLNLNSSLTYYCDASQYFNFSNQNLIDLSPTQQATKAKEIGESVYNELRSLGLHPTSLTSPIRVYEKEVLDHINMPNIDDYSEKIGMFGYECCKHNWVETFKVGYFPKVYDYDINGAYPSQLAKLVDTRFGYWHEDVKNFNSIEKAHYGFYHCFVSIKAKFSPIIYTLYKGNEVTKNFTPNGTWDTYLTRDEVLFINKWELGKVELISGVEFFIDEGLLNGNSVESKNLYPLRQQIKALSNEKNRSTGMRRERIKDIMEGIFGKLLEIRNGKIGESTKLNTVWAAQTETPIRLKVAEFCLTNGVVPISVIVDGCTLEKFVDVGTNQVLGEWKYECESECISLGTGSVALKSKNKVLRDFSLSYDWLESEIKANPLESFYTLKKKRPITLAIGCNENKLDKLGQMCETSKVIEVGYEDKRLYGNFPKCGQDILSGMYESSPLDISMISCKESKLEKLEV